MLNQDEIGHEQALNLMELRKWLEGEESKELSKGVVKITLKSSINERHKVMSVVYDSKEQFNQFYVLMSFIEIASMAYVSFFLYDDIEGQIISNSFILISQ